MSFGREVWIVATNQLKDLKPKEKKILYKVYTVKYTGILLQHWIERGHSGDHAPSGPSDNHRETQISMKTKFRDFFW